MDDIAKMKVLVCDDEALARMRLKRLVEMANMEVSAEAASGREAVESAGRLRPDVVLMDIKMPGIGGLEATRRMLRQDDGLRVILPMPQNCDNFDHGLAPLLPILQERFQNRVN